jgi:hypothetical protein
MNVSIEDDAGGSGVKYFDMYVSEDGGPYIKFDSLLTDPVVQYTGQPGKSYCFFSIGTDNVLNIENLKNACELTVTLSNPALPLTWINFSGVQQQQDVKLSWLTTNEINVNHFILERSENGTAFAEIAKVNARGENGNLTRYNHVDANAAKMGVPELFYRLRRIDKDGASGYSSTIRVKLSSYQTELLVNSYPNPFVNELRAEIIPVHANDVIKTVELVNVLGKVVYSRSLNLTGRQVINLQRLEALAKGIYLLKVVVNSEVKTIKVTKQ